MGTNKFSVNSELKSGTKIKVHNNRGHEITIDEPEKAGGTDKGMNPVEITLASLAGCLSITAKSLADKMKIQIDKLSISIEGEIDEEAMSSADKFSGFKEIRYNINFESDSPKKKIEKLYQSIEKYCPVSDTIKKSVPVKGDYQLN
ncbi:MAG: OsmC family protein [Halanaerobiales bacterium]|nr:OsmC family protein [Halanaerobiales bacterium]